MCADCVEEVTVVAHHEHRVLEVGQPVLQPCHCLKVQVVGRLVKQQVVGVAEQSLGQEHAHLLVGAHVLHQHIVAVLLDTEARQQSRGVALGVPPLKFGELLLKFGGLDAVLVAEIGFCIEGVLLGHDLIQDRVAAHHGVDDRALVKLEVVLAQHRQALARTERHAAHSGLELARQYLHQRGLAGAVGSDYAVAVATVKGQVHVLEQDALPELHAQIVGLYHLLIPPCAAFMRFII